ncbi:MAG: hypothetical protein USCAAHI_00149 [Beijerinckiaceae bacterium]|jgi:hypothetical protein|nr:MAG: hypothetical protein USCAAHI_00149 [Beijerinckiaceae bacterium]
MKSRNRPTASRLDAENAREEIHDIVHEIVAIKNVAISIGEQEDLIDDICNDVLGYGPLEPLLGRDESILTTGRFHVCSRRVRGRDPSRDAEAREESLHQFSPVSEGAEQLP